MKNLLNLQSLGFSKATPAIVIPSTLLTNLLAYWKLDDNTGTQAIDATGNGYTGNFMDGATPHYVAGKINSGGNFHDGNILEIGSLSTPLVGLTAMSMNVWTKPANITSNDNEGIIGLRPGGNDTDDFYMLQLGSSANVEMRFGNSSAQTTTNQVNGALSLTEFVMLTLVYTGTQLISYVNGVQGAINNASGSFGGAGNALCIGADRRFGNTYRGGVDEVGFWKKALSQTEITALYAAGAGLQYPF
jgi:hypothetical protein